MKDRKPLVGSYDYQLDPKNRIRILSKLRGEETKLYFTKGRDGCISAYFEKEFYELLDKLTEISTKDPKARDELREFTYSTVDVDIDTQGRLVIPRNFIAQAKIKQDVVVCGAITKLEIWAKEVYDDYCSKRSTNFDNIDIF